MLSLSEIAQIQTSLTAFNPCSPHNLSHPMSSFSFSNNLVEISALTALLGSEAAEAMVLGARGAAGVAWAATSSFGTVSVVKACLSGACGGWLRQSLGLRTLVSDDAVGLELRQDSHREAKLRLSLGEPLAIVCHVQKGTRMDAYAIDSHNSFMLRSIPETAAGDPIQVFVYSGNKFYRSGYAPLQVAAVLLSTLKIAESYVLWRSGSGLLGIVSAIPWLYFMTGLTLIKTREFLQIRQRSPEVHDLDIIAGRLPTVSRQGGVRKIVLGIAEHPRISLSWQLCWAGGAIVTTAALLYTYIIMADASRNTVLMWAGFQLLWLSARILVYHLTEPATPLLRRNCSLRPYQTLSTDLRMRVVNLTLALGQSQTAFHPRGYAQYAGDAFSSNAVHLVMQTRTSEDVFPLHHPVSVASDSTATRIEIIAVVGDTSLAAAMWMVGSDIGPMDMYDTCVVVLTAPGYSGQLFSVPAARVLSGTVPYDEDLEKENGPVFIPKGVPHPEIVTWWYWIPCSSSVWLEMSITAGVPLIGKHECSIRTDEQITAKLSAGRLNIALKSVEEVKEVLAFSAKGRDALSYLLG
ncbi:hypothetical protein R3P38DRAFT_2900627 [Favolaschia claudopus]|uniref:Uncharacterized protein n=1 Tax=Favolaschia claudopus TaxID=2862362 RepID=A0AAW0CMX6_9AGAR